VLKRDETAFDEVLESAILKSNTALVDGLMDDSMNGLMAGL
jgi:hypothetical protein